VIAFARFFIAPGRHCSSYQTLIRPHHPVSFETFGQSLCRLIMTRYMIILDQSPSSSPSTPDLGAHPFRVRHNRRIRVAPPPLQCPSRRSSTEQAPMHEGSPSPTSFHWFPAPTVLPSHSFFVDHPFLLTVRSNIYLKLRSRSLNAAHFVFLTDSNGDYSRSFPSH
jgi:hypothetical protein